MLSSKSRLENIVADILLDMETRDRLGDGRGNVILVSTSIYQAANSSSIFDATDLSGKCAVVTSYKPLPQSIKNEESGALLGILKDCTSTISITKCWLTFLMNLRIRL